MLTLDDVMGTVEAAQYLDCAVITLKKHVQKQHITPDKKIGGTLIFTRDTLDRFKAARRAVGRPARVTAGARKVKAK